MTGPARAPGWLWLLIALGMAGNLLGWLTIGILPDEAYYWVWSQNLQAGYYDHPPLVGWVIRPFTALFGNAAWVIRLPAALGWGVSAGAAYLLGRRLLGSPRAGVLAVLIWSSLPIVQAGFHIVTPDTPLVLFAWLTWLFALRALESGRTAEWLATGACAGLALVGKYPGVLLLGAILVGLLTSGPGRRALATRGPWLGALIAIGLFMPVVWWNASHDWISFAFQLGHGVHKRPEGPPWQMLGLFLGAQMAVTMPWTWVGMAASALPTRAQRDRLGSGAFALLAAGFWLPLALFGAAGLTTEGQANWPVVAYVPGTLLLAALMDGWLFDPARARRWKGAVVIGAYLLVVVVLDLVRFPHWLERAGIRLPPQRTQLSQTYGWGEVGGPLRELLAAQAPTHPEGCLAVGDKLQTTAMLALLLDDTRRVTVASDSRFNQFTLWAREQPIPRERLCVLFSQSDRRADVAERIELPGQGSWQLARVLEHRNPDLTVRWSAFYLPEPAR